MLAKHALSQSEKQRDAAEREISELKKLLQKTSVAIQTAVGQEQGRVLLLEKCVKELEEERSQLLKRLEQAVKAREKSERYAFMHVQIHTHASTHARTYTCWWSDYVFWTGLSLARAKNDRYAHTCLSNQTKACTHARTHVHAHRMMKEGSQSFERLQHAAEARKLSEMCNIQNIIASVYARTHTHILARIHARTQACKCMHTYFYGIAMTLLRARLCCVQSKSKLEQGERVQRLSNVINAISGSSWNKFKLMPVQTGEWNKPHDFLILFFLQRGISS